MATSSINTSSGVATGGHANGANGITTGHPDSSDGAVTALNTLIQLWTMLKSRLNEPGLQAEINRGLHDLEKLPDKEIVPLAAKAGDVLHDIEQMLQPTQLVLADHLLGTFASNRSFGF
ncbi:hypothetical protein MMC30_004733 [Trapelia coarctata]|nr:hypothetical protein [Trapelia coarctata]